MHITILQGQEIVNFKTTYYYDICINGTKHFSEKYSEFAKFHKRMSKQFPKDMKTLTFPPELFQLLTLSKTDLETRRLSLELYFQKMTEIRNNALKDCMSLELFNIQKKLAPPSKDAQINIRFPYKNGENPRIHTIQLKSHDNYTDVFQKCAAAIGLSEDLYPYFGLYLVQDKNKKILRKFDTHDAFYLTFESATLAMQKANRGDLSVHFRKSYWNKNLDHIVIANTIGKELLFNQIHNDVSDGLSPLVLPQYIDDVERIHDIRNIDQYNYLVFKNCIFDYPNSNLENNIYIGEFVLEFVDTQTNKAIKFDLTRIRSWKLSTIEDPSDGNLEEFAFELQTKPDEYKWFSILTSQAIFMCDCLRNMAEELLIEQTKENMMTAKFNPNLKITAVAEGGDA